MCATWFLPVHAAYPDRLAVRTERGSASSAGAKRATFALAGGANVKLLDERDPLGQVGGLIVLHTTVLGMQNVIYSYGKGRGCAMYGRYGMQATLQLWGWVCCAAPDFHQAVLF